MGRGEHEDKGGASYERVKREQKDHQYWNLISREGEMGTMGRGVKGRWNLN